MVRQASVMLYSSMTAMLAAAGQRCHFFMGKNSMAQERPSIRQASAFCPVAAMACPLQISLVLRPTDAPRL